MIFRYLLLDPALSFYHSYDEFYQKESVTRSIVTQNMRRLVSACCKWNPSRKNN